VPDWERYLGTLVNVVLNAPDHHAAWRNAKRLKD
jgi:hypothetical protein